MRLIKILDTSELHRFVGGRSKYNAKRKRMKQKRQEKVKELIGVMSQKKIATIFNVSQSTICRDVQQIQNVDGLPKALKKFIKQQQKSY